MRLPGSDVKLPPDVFFGSSGTWRIGPVQNMIRNNRTAAALEGLAVGNA
jgi:hypothetical protein